MKKKVVIAIFENESINRFIYKRMLEPYKDRASFYIFDTTEEGLDKAHDLHYDVAFIDMHLKGEFFGGISVVKKLKAVSANTKMVAMTTLIQEGDIERAISGGFIKCLEKPLPFLDLDKLLAGILDN